MAIISGGRINIWNAVKKQFEVVHPETEVARITDFADGIVKKLALTSAMTAVTALQTDSWFGKLLKMALTASGVKYNIAQNGYICFGSFFGGLIIQWGTNTLNLNGITQAITLPINIAWAVAAAVTMQSGDFIGFLASPYWTGCTQTTILITPDYETNQGYAGTGQAAVTWILISF